MVVSFSISHHLFFLSCSTSLAFSLFCFLPTSCSIPLSLSLSQVSFRPFYLSRSLYFSQNFPFSCRSIVLSLLFPLLSSRNVAFFRLNFRLNLFRFLPPSLLSLNLRLHFLLIPCLLFHCISPEFLFSLFSLSFPSSSFPSHSPAKFLFHNCSFLCSILTPSHRPLLFTIPNLFLLCEQHLLLLFFYFADRSFLFSLG